MTGRLVEFPIQGGETILVEVTDARGDGRVTRGLHHEHLVEHTERTFDQAVGHVQPAASALIAKLKGIPDPPDEVNVEFGLELSAEAGAFIASASTAANFKVSLTWHRDSS
jgi:hypothetical protein